MVNSGAIGNIVAYIVAGFLQAKADAGISD